MRGLNLLVKKSSRKSEHFCRVHSNPLQVLNPLKLQNIKMFLNGCIKNFASFVFQKNYVNMLIIGAQISTQRRNGQILRALTALTFLCQACNTVSGQRITTYNIHVGSWEIQLWPCFLGPFLQKARFFWHYSFFSMKPLKIPWLFLSYPRLMRVKNPPPPQFFITHEYPALISLTLIRMTKDEKVLAIFKGLML